VNDCVTPRSFEEAAATLRDATAASRPVRIVGAGTKLAWLAPDVTTTPPLVLRTLGLTQPIEHHPEDRVAVISAGVPVALARNELSAAGQLLALDPPLHFGGAGEATVGGVVASADAGPISHRYGRVREQVLGVAVALTDGTIARAGGRVPRSVAGYDLASLYTGSFGTLGVILAVCVRLHPLPEATATAIGTTTDTAVLAATARHLTDAVPELQALDVAWRGGRGGLLAQAAGEQPAAGAARAARLMREDGLTAVDVIEDDGGLWARQRAGQRSAQRALARVSVGPSRLAAVLALADACGATVIARAALGVCYLELEPQWLRALLGGLPAGARGVLLDLPAGAAVEERRVRGGDAGTRELMSAVKLGFDPAGICNPGALVTSV